MFSQQPILSFSALEACTAESQQVVSPQPPMVSMFGIPHAREERVLNQKRIGRRWLEICIQATPARDLGCKSCMVVRIMFSQRPTTMRPLNNGAVFLAMTIINLSLGQVALDLDTPRLDMGLIFKEFMHLEGSIICQLTQVKTW